MKETIGKGREGNRKTRVARQAVGLPARRRRWRQRRTGTGTGPGPNGRGGWQGIEKGGKARRLRACEGQEGE